MKGSVAPSRIDSLRQLRGRIEACDPASNASFRDLFSEAQTLLELTDAQLADELLVSRTTVNRWKRGTNLPMIALRKPILRWMDERLAQRLRAIEPRPSIRTGGGSWSMRAPLAAKGR